MEEETQVVLPTNRTNVENYNGTSWTEIAEINTGVRNTRGVGTTTAGLAVGGEAPPATVKELTQNNGMDQRGLNVNNLNTARQQMGAFGTTTSALSQLEVLSTPTEEWNGSSWTEIADLNTGRLWSRLCGEC